MTLIYEPRGRAAEYSTLALNIYNGCDHDCAYCYVKSIPFGEHSAVATPRKGLERLDAELTRHPVSRQVLLSFMSDPYCAADQEYCATRTALKTLLKHQVPVAILTKGGKRCLHDLDLFMLFDRIKIGATLTFACEGETQKWEPGAADWFDRVETLRIIHDTGVRTWASLEPVIDPGSTLHLIRITAPFVDEYRVGRWNHDPRANNINWKTFGIETVELLRSLGKPFYIKADLRAHLPAGFLAPIECDQNALNLELECRDRSEFPEVKS